MYVCVIQCRVSAQVFVAFGGAPTVGFTVLPFEKNALGTLDPGRTMCESTVRRGGSNE